RPLRGHGGVFACGDRVRVRTEDASVEPLPGVAPVAMQQGRYVARVIRARLRGRGRKPFRYVDKGNLATIGRSKAVADIKGVRLSGFPAWVIWLVVHLAYLIGFENRLVVLLRWTISFITRGRGSRVIVGRDGELRAAVDPARPRVDRVDHEMAAAPGVARERGAHVVCGVGLDDVHDPSVPERPAEHDEALLDEPVHERGVIQPTGLF